MSSINPHYTLNYQQPEEYRFSHDSVFLARMAFEKTQKDQVPMRVLDLCAGCGVIGIDYLIHLQNAGFESPQKIDFLEVQSIYHPYFAANIAQVQNVKNFEFLTMNYAEVENRRDLNSQYDLIMCNPPYFKKEMGVLSSSEFKNRCRFFLDSDLAHLLKAIHFLLKPTGQAYVLLKDLEVNGFRLQKEFSNFSEKLKLTALKKIRTTDVYQIQVVS